MEVSRWVGRSRVWFGALVVGDKPRGMELRGLSPEPELEPEAEPDTSDDDLPSQSMGHLGGGTRDREVAFDIGQLRGGRREVEGIGGWSEGKGILGISC